MIDSWALKTQANYNTYLEKYVNYCKMVGICDPYVATFKEGMSFLAYFFHDKEQKHGVLCWQYCLLKIGKHFSKIQISSG